MLRRLLPLLLLGFAACGGGEEELDVFRSPLYVESGSSLSWVLDSRRAKIFAWDGEREILRTLRGAGVEDRLGVPVIVGAGDDDLLFGGMALDPDEGSIAVSYSLGVGAREGRLAVLSLGTPPLEEAPVEFTVSTAARGPFATPDGNYIMVTPQAGLNAEWATFPQGSTATAPPARRLAFSAGGDRVFAASDVTDVVHVLAWPGLAPVTDITVSGAPLDIDVSPDDGTLAVVTSESLALYSADGTREAVHPLEGLPWQVRFSRNFESRVVAVLNHQGTLRFYDRDEGLCGIDGDSTGFQILDFSYQDSGRSSNNRLVDVEPVGCRSLVPSDRFTVTYEGVVTAGTATLAAPDALTGATFGEAGVSVGDRLLLEGFSAEITGIASDRLFFSPATDTGLAAEVDFAVRAVGDWVVRGNETGFVGRAETGVPFTGEFLSFEIAEGQAPPDTDDRFLFTTDPNVTPAVWGSPLFDLAENAQGRWLIPAFRLGRVTIVDLRRSGNTWVIETLYNIR